MAEPEGTSTVRFAQETSVPRPHQGNEDHCPELSLGIDPQGSVRKRLPRRCTRYLPLHASPAGMTGSSVYPRLDP